MARNISKNVAQSPSPLPKKLKRSQQKINRLKALVSQKKTTLAKQGKNERKARTRTLIQIGGNVLKSGLMKSCGIEAGEDLQDPTFYDKAALLVGFLQDALDNAHFTEKNKEEWRRRGELTLKYEFVRKQIQW